MMQTDWASMRRSTSVQSRLSGAVCVDARRLTQRVPNAVSAPRHILFWTMFLAYMKECLQDSQQARMQANYPKANQEVRWIGAGQNGFLQVTLFQCPVSVLRFAPEGVVCLSDSELTNKVLNGSLPPTHFAD